MSAPDLARRSLLRGRAPSPPPVRPPWARLDAFEDLCTRCRKCAAACPEQIVVRGDGGFPALDFSRGECTFCGACADACPEPLFKRRAAVPWQARAVIDDKCLAARGIVCRTCRDECPADAVTFELAPGRVAQPRVQLDRCTGCGACVATCPADAIKIAAEGVRDGC
jgi:ferredoxin-type protein NapF